MTTKHPVDLQRDGSLSGLASTEAEALAIARDQYSGPEWNPASITVTLSDIQLTGHYRTRGDLESAYDEEIAEGWVTPVQVFSGWVPRGDYWLISAEEVE